MKRGFLLIDHGSRRSESNQQLLVMRDYVQSLHPDIPCMAAHMEIAGPSISEQVDLLIKLEVRHIHVLCYFLSNGRHITEDIPRLVQEALAKHPTCRYDIASALGPSPALADLLLQRSPFSSETSA